MKKFISFIDAELRQVKASLCSVEHKEIHRALQDMNKWMKTKEEA